MHRVIMLLTFLLRQLNNLFYAVAVSPQPLLTSPLSNRLFFHVWRGKLAVSLLDKLLREVAQYRSESMTTMCIT